MGTETIATSSDGHAAKTAEFLRWFKNIPGTTFSDAIQIADLRCRDSGRGIVAVQDIPAESAIFTIPRHAIISTETSALPQKLPDLFESQGDEDHEQGLDSWSGLILVMMYEFLLGDQSRWKPYLDVLPEEFDTPMFWSNAELSELQASAVVGKIGKDSAEEMFRSRLLPAIRENPNVFTSSGQWSDNELLQLAHRMGSTIMAYAFDLEGEEAGDETGEDGWIEDREGKSLMGMVAMADILNADAEFNAHVSHGDDALVVTTLRNIQAGEEILNYYGPHPNSELLRRYGYVTDRHSRYDVVEIPWEAVQNCLVSELRVTPELVMNAMERLDPEEMEDVFVLEREAVEPDSNGRLIGPAAMKDVPLDLKEQLKALVKVLQKMDDNLLPDKRKRSDKIRSILAGGLRLIASRYPTNLAEDQELLKQVDLSRRHRMAITVRLGEKRVIQEALDLLTAPTGYNAADPDVSTAKRVKRAAQ